jgi:hypothetical protein
VPARSALGAADGATDRTAAARAARRTRVVRSRVADVEPEDLELVAAVAAEDPSRTESLVLGEAHDDAAADALAGEVDHPGATGGLVVRVAAAEGYHATLRSAGRPRADQARAAERRAAARERRAAISQAPAAPVSPRSDR